MIKKFEISKIIVEPFTVNVDITKEEEEAWYVDPEDYEDFDEWTKLNDSLNSKIDGAIQKLINMDILVSWECAEY